MQSSIAMVIIRLMLPMRSTEGKTIFLGRHTEYTVSFCPPSVNLLNT